MTEAALYPHQVRSVAAITVLYVFRMLGLFMVLPVLALYGRDYAEATPMLLGLALGVYGLSQALLQIPFGLASDRWGRRPIIVLGLCLFTAGSLFAAYADSIYELIAGRFLQGTGAIAGALMALVADVTSEKNRTKAMAAVGASIGASFAIALVLGPVITAAGGLDLVFAITAGCGVVGLLLTFTVVPNPPVVRGRHSARTSLLLPTLRNPHLLRLNGGIFVLHFVLMASFVVVPDLLELAGFERERHWLVYLSLLLATFFLMLPLVMAAERRGYARQIFIAAVALLAVAELGLWVFEAWWLGTVVALFLFLLAFNALEASLPSLLSKTASAEVRGTASGLYSTSQFAGAFAGGALGGLLVTHLGLEAVLWLGAALVGLWLLASFYMTHPQDLETLAVARERESIAEELQRLCSLPGVIRASANGSEIELTVNRRRFRGDSLEPAGSSQPDSRPAVELDKELV